MEQSTHTHTHTHTMQGCLAYPQQQQVASSVLYWREWILGSSVCLLMTVQILT